LLRLIDAIVNSVSLWKNSLQILAVAQIPLILWPTKVSIARWIDLATTEIG
jgi:hypothetical protein